ncbi:MAG TPA: sulfotransferase domain-containing protein [Anaerolineae bacterium]|nr:sulfotransferase domain-containing protein [Anaerolineae bacterium]
MTNYPRDSLINQAKLLRRLLRQLRQKVRFKRISLEGIPILFGNSFPKSGTHLLTQILSGFEKVAPVVDSGLPAVLTYEGPTGTPREVSVILKDLKRLQPGDIAYGHIHALPELIAWMCKEGVASFFIYRDPRDVVVSHVHYVTHMAPNHVHHRYYQEDLKNFDERLCVSITGRADLDIPFPNIQERFAPYLGWLKRPEVLSIKFEDLIDNRTEALGRIVDHILARGLSIDMDRDRIVQIISENIHPERSPTYRSGKVGRWREAFSDDNIKLFKKVSGDLLITLGYENGTDW